MKSHLIDHFNQQDHNHENLQVQILNKIDENSPNMKQALTNNELEWIRMLSAAYPFGLNENIKGYGNASKVYDTKNTKSHPYLFYKFTRNENKKRISNSNRHKKYEIKNPIVILENLNKLLKSFNHKDAYNTLKSLTKRAINNLAMTSASNIHYHNHKVTSFITSFISGNRKKSKTINENRTFINIILPFINNKQDQMNNSAVFNNASIRKCFKEIYENEKIPRIRLVYKYNTPYSLSLFNYNHHLRNLTINDLIISQNKKCDCLNNPEHIYGPANHIITGNPHFIDTLQEIINFGTKHKFNKNLNREILEEMFHTAASTLCNKISNITKCNEIFKLKLHDSIMTNFEKYYDQFSRRNIPSDLTTDLPEVDKGDFQNFIITPVDKAGSNYSFCCKKYYNQIMMQELGISCQNNQIACTGNETYRPIQESEDHIITKHASKLKQLNINMDPDNETLPLIYAIPKMHKTPYKFRFISGAKKSSAKQLSVILLNALKTIREHFHSYCNIIKEKTGKTMCWSINNNTTLLEYLRNHENRTDNILTYDFSTLFTGLPHDVIITNIKLYL
jgi:hypothetical protein